MWVGVDCYKLFWYFLLGRVLFLYRQGGVEVSVSRLRKGRGLFFPRERVLFLYWQRG